MAQRLQQETEDEATGEAPKQDAGDLAWLLAKIKEALPDVEPISLAFLREMVQLRDADEQTTARDSAFAAQQPEEFLSTSIGVCALGTPAPLAFGTINR